MRSPVRQTFALAMNVITAIVPLKAPGSGGSVGTPTITSISSSTTLASSKVVNTVSAALTVPTVNTEVS